MSKLLIKGLLALSIVLVFPAQAMPNVPNILNKDKLVEESNKPAWYNSKDVYTSKHDAPTDYYRISDFEMRQMLSDLASTNDENKRQEILAEAFNKYTGATLTDKDIDLNSSSIRIKTNNETASVSLIAAIGAILATGAIGAAAPFGTTSLIWSGVTAVLVAGTFAAVDIALTGDLSSFIAIGVGALSGFLVPAAGIILSGAIIAVCLNKTDRDFVKTCFYTPAKNVIHHATGGSVWSAEAP